MKQQLHKPLFFASVLILLAVLNYGSAFAQAGAVDSAFGSNGQAILQTDAAAIFKAVAIQQNGKIIAAGTDFRSIVARYNANGILDSGFGKNGIADTSLAYSTTANDVAIQQDGKIVVVGNATTSDFNQSKSFVLRYLQNGRLDESFGNKGCVLINYQGNSYSSFVRLIIQKSGKIVCAGYGTSATTENFIIYRFNSNGTIDSSFSDDGIKSISFSQPALLTDFIKQPDGKLVAVGSSNVSNIIYMARCTSDGKLDKKFGDNGKIIVADATTRLPYSVVTQSNGRIIVSGVYKETATIFRAFTSNGIPDSSFGSKSIKVINAMPTEIFKISKEKDDKIIAAGTVNSKFGMYRININGKLDSSFGNNGYVMVNTDNGNTAYNVKLQADNKILLCGNNNRSGLLCRFENDPALFSISNINSKKKDLVLIDKLVFLYNQY